MLTWYFQKNIDQNFRENYFRQFVSPIFRSFKLSRIFFLFLFLIWIVYVVFLLWLAVILIKLLCLMHSLIIHLMMNKKIYFTEIFNHFNRKIIKLIFNPHTMSLKKKTDLLNKQRNKQTNKTKQTNTKHKRWKMHLDLENSRKLYSFPFFF